jgi:xanthine dehydrogenase YagR molybdenum-binding subunit
MFTTTGHRPETRQHLRLATDAQGKLVSLRHESINTTSFTDCYVEACGTSTRSLYSCPNVLVSHSSVEVHQGTPTSMRAPGAAPGLFALESAMDEMAEKVGMDPLAFRKLNGITGLAAAIANAVYHATGKRIRNLPISRDKQMDQTNADSLMSAANTL